MSFMAAWREGRGIQTGLLIKNTKDKKGYKQTATSNHSKDENAKLGINYFTHFGAHSAYTFCSRTTCKWTLKKDMRIEW